MSLPSSHARFLLRNYVIGYSLALTIVVMDSVVLAYVLVHSDWAHAGTASIEALGAFASAMALVPIGLFIGLHRQQHAVRLAESIVRHDIAQAPISMLQAGNDGSLEMGETLQVTRLGKIRFPALIGGFAFTTIGLGILIDSLLFSSHTVSSRTPTESWEGYLTSLSPLAIITLAFPFLLGAMLLLPANLSNSWQRRLTIKAYDVGITIQQSGQHEVSLRWDEIEYVVFTPARRVWPYALAPFDGYYVIGNAQRFVTLNTWYSAALALQTNPLLRYQFTPTSDDFMIGIVRILATIQVKQALEMRVSQRLLARTRRLAQVWDASDDDGDDETLPPALIQPRADLVMQMEHAHETIVLRPRLKFVQIARETGLYALIGSLLFAPFWGGEALATGVFHVHDKYSIAFQTRSEGLIATVCLGGAITVISAWYSWADARKQRFTLIANEQGLTLMRRQHKEKLTVPWDTITAWAIVMLSEDSMHETGYIIHGSHNLVWKESASDTLSSSRRGANETFQQRAEKLHALIAAKTHFPLLSIAYEPDTRTWWQRLFT